MFDETEIIRALNYECSFWNYFTPLFTSLPFLVYRNATFKFPVKFVISESALVTFFTNVYIQTKPPTSFCLANISQSFYSLHPISR